MATIQSAASPNQEQSPLKSKVQATQVLKKDFLQNDSRSRASMISEKTLLKKLATPLKGYRQPRKFPQCTRTSGPQTFFSSQSLPCLSAKSKVHRQHSKLDSRTPIEELTTMMMNKTVFADF